MTGVGCGVSMKTNGTNVYATGSFNQGQTCAASATVCADASTLSDSSGACGSLTSISTLGLERADVSGNQAKSLVVDRTWVSGI
jgi:fluoride ion exporter CrcB/FEX